MDELIVTPEDIQALCEINPLASEQLKAIVLQRRVASLEQQLAAQLSNGHVDEQVPEEVKSE